MVRCDKCGFLAVRRLDTRDLAEVEEVMRTKWSVPSRGNMPVFDELPLCSVGAAHLHDEIGPAERGPILAVLSRERDCGSFTPWVHGLTPGEHREMLDGREMRAWQAEERERERAWQGAREERDRRWKEDQASRANWTVVLAALIGLAGVVVGAVLVSLLK